jgi:hypothetical protein
MALRNGARLGVSHADVFPFGCHLVPNSITEVEDYDERTRQRSPAIDRVTGSRVWQCRVSDNDPELGARSHEVVVKILSDRKPVPPTGADFELVEFDRLTVTPYINNDRCSGGGRCGARMAFSLRAMGIKPGRPAAQPAKDAA